MLLVLKHLTLHEVALWQLCTGVAAFGFNELQRLWMHQKNLFSLTTDGFEVSRFINQN